MIVVALFGGLGNQMFQYALGRRLAFDRQTTLKLDVSALANNTLRNYRLDHFAVQSEIAVPDEVERFRSRRLDRLGKRLVEKLTRPYFRRSIVYEQHLGFDPNILAVQDDVYLSGYWPNELYFASIEKTVRNELTVIKPPDPANADMLAQIEAANSVSLHIRRGDYVSNPQNQKIHGLQPLSYYVQAVRRIAGTVAKPHFFVFSDEPEWARQNLELDYPTTIVNINGPDRDYQDLRLLSACKHHILANSTFSWWGAWLGRCPGKQVLAPAQWLNDPNLNRQFTLPPSWQRVTI